MYDPKHLEMKKHLLLGLKKEGRQRHATKLKERFAPPPPKETEPMPGMDASQAPAPAGDTAPGEISKEELAELLARLQ